MPFRLILVLLVTLIGGAAVAYLVAPGPWELAAMKTRGGSLTEAREAYESLLAQYGLSRETVLPLSGVYDMLGEEDESIDLMRRYITSEPKDAAARRAYADLLRDAERIDDYAAALEDAARASGDVDLWRTLAGLREYRGEHAKQADALSAVDEAGKATFDEMITLATLLASSGQTTAALDVSARALKRSPRTVTLDLVQAHVALALAAGKKEMAHEILGTWNAAHPAPGDAVAFSQALESMGAPDLALRLLETAPAAGAAQVRLEALQLKATYVDPAAAYTDLLAWRSKGSLPPAGYAMLTTVGFRLGRFDDTFKALSGVMLSSLPLATQIALIEEAARERRSAFLDAAREQAGPEWRGIAPAAAARLASARKDRQAGTLALRSLREARSDEERAAAATALVHTGRRPDAARAVAELSAKFVSGALDADAFDDLVEAALVAGQTDIALRVAQRVAASSPVASDHVLFARALVAAGRHAEARTVLSDLDPRDPAVEIALLEALRAEGDRVALQNFLYRRLADVAVPRPRRNDMLTVLAESAPLEGDMGGIVPSVTAELNGTLLPEERRPRIQVLAYAAPAAAIPSARLLAESGRTDDILLYADVLFRAGEDAESVRVLADAAQRARDKQAKADFIDALREHGAIEAALPLLADLAAREGGDWRFAYEEALEKLGQRDALIASLLARANDPVSTPEERRNVAFSLLSLNRKTDAEAIFLALATGAGPSSTDVDNLLWLWGPRPEQRQVQWMIDAARQARAQDRAGWIGRIVAAGAPREGVALAEEFLSGSNDAGLLDATVNGLIVLKDVAGLERILVPAVARIDDAQTAEHFARRAQELGANYPAGLLFERAAELDPARIENLGRAGLAAFYSGHANRATGLLHTYRERGGTSMEARFAAAELALRDGELGQARNGYESVIAASDARPGDVALGRLKALALLRLKRPREAETTFQALIAEHPGDPLLRADAGGALLDSGNLEGAMRALESPSPTFADQRETLRR